MKMEGDISELNRGEDRTTRASLDLLYHISREFAAALDLRTVLEKVLLLSMKTVGAKSGSIMVMDDQGNPVESSIITGLTVHSHTTPRLQDTLDRGLAGWVVRNREAVLINNTNEDDRWLGRRYDDEDTSNPKSAVSAPLLLREKILGVMTLAHDVPGFFTPDHLALVQAIADQAGIAVLNARLYGESQRQARVMTALAESATAITSTLHLEDVLLTILEQIRHALQVQAVSIALFDPACNDFHFQAAIGWQGQPGPDTRLKAGQGIAGWVAVEECGLVVHDTKEDPRFDAEVDQRTGLQARAMACAPIHTRGKLIGILEAINPQEGFFDPDALLVLAGIGSLAGTAIRHAQLFERLEGAHKRYRELFEDSINPIFVTDAQAHIIEANRQAVQVTGFGKEALVGMQIDRIHDTDRQKTGEGYERLSTGETVTYESLLRTKAQKAIPIQAYVRQVKIDERAHLQWIFQDISERKNVDSLRNDLLSMIYHDLRSPLANVVSSLETMASVIPSEEEDTMGSLLAISRRSTDRIQRLTNSLLDIYRLEAGQRVGNRQPFELTGLIREAVEAVTPNIQAKNQRIEMVLPELLPPVLGDLDMIWRVLINLLENAIKFTPVGGQIDAGSCLDSGEAVVWVQDTGPGIPAHEHERVFEKFARLSTPNTPKGLGLGLTYCRLAVEEHGGRIWVESETGQGARFIFTLPLVKFNHPDQQG